MGVSLSYLSIRPFYHLSLCCPVTMNFFHLSYHFFSFVWVGRKRELHRLLYQTTMYSIISIFFKKSIPCINSFNFYYLLFYHQNLHNIFYFHWNYILVYTNNHQNFHNIFLFHWNRILVLPNNH